LHGTDLHVSEQNIASVTSQSPPGGPAPNPPLGS
jgi:hypothetical protein